MITQWKGPKAVVRDVLLIWILTFVGGFFIGFFMGVTGKITAGSEPPIGLIAISNLIFGTIGFCIAACLIREKRWKHLSLVAIFLWLSSFINILVVPSFNLAHWIASLIATFMMMGIGGGLSYLFVR